MSGRKSPLKTIREHCLLCMNGSFRLVRECTTDDCPLHPLRMGRAVKGVSPLKSVRQMCLHCQAESSQRVRDCDPNLLSGEVCPLWPYRLGKGNRVLSKAEREQRQKALPVPGERQGFASRLATEGVREG